MHRRRLWLTLLGAATAGTVLAYRKRGVRSDTVRPAPPPAPETSAAEGSRLGDATAGEPASTGAAAMVGAAMGSGSSALATNGSRTNGSSPIAARAPAATPVRVPRSAPAELPPARRPSGATLAGLAAAAGVAAILLGGWAFVSVRSDAGGGDAPPASVAVLEEAVSLLSGRGTEQIPLRRSVGRIVLVVEPPNRASLVLNGLGPAPEGMAYQAWVIAPGAERPASAALFDAREPVVRLARPVERGATVAVTLERSRGALAPTRTPKLVATRSRD